MPQSSSLRIGTRASKLARVQADTVARLLTEGGTACETILVKTTGDRILDRPLADVGGKGLFTKELEEALLRETVDLAVHSMKDVPTALPDGLGIAAMLPRENPADVLIAKTARTLSDLPKGARVGTSSVRRKAQLLRARPDIECVLLRGNVDTRLAKLAAGEMDAILLAMSGLKRLGLADRVTCVLDTDEWLPSLAQGAVGIEIRMADMHTASPVALLDHPQTSVALACERAFQGALDGSCRTPIAGLAIIEGSRLSFRGEVVAPDGSAFAETAFKIELGSEPMKEAAKAGRNAGAELRPRAAHWLGL
ncbi:MAG: hydroxymethylbilane synthase [Alphaproteobacteria bacterium]|nr:hydroxymethylbilane synthase [Alphaproteobacteria bacterium]MDE2267184.1 hydroxymethylbilane synthase [Alphaproteobacteria bacterium]